MKKPILLIFIALIAAGCNGSLRTGTFADDIAMPAYEGSADSLLLSVSLEYVKGSGPAAEAVNRAILSGALDFEGWEGTVEEAAGAYRENLIDEYLTDNSGPEAITWEDRIDGAFTGSYKAWKNYVLTYYSYRGGPHGIQTVSPIVFSRDGRVVTEEDLFAEGWRGPVSELLQKAVLSSMETEDPELAGLVEAELIGPNGNFSVGPDGIEWIFQPYEVGPYALGIVSATLSWKQLKPYLK
jgi:hypothetical protein